MLVITVILSIEPILPESNVRFWLDDHYRIESSFGHPFDELLIDLATVYHSITDILMDEEG